MSGPHVFYWLSALSAFVGLVRSATRLFVLLTGLRWTLRGVAQGDRPEIFREFARAASGRSTRVHYPIRRHRDYDSLCTWRLPMNVPSPEVRTQASAGDGCAPSFEEPQDGGPECGT
jgi:hypothetical protein